MTRWPCLLAALAAFACGQKQAAPPPGDEKPAALHSKKEGKKPARKLGPYLVARAPGPLPFIKTGAGFGEAVGRSIDFLRDNGKRPGVRLASGIAERELLTVLFGLQGAGCVAPAFLEKHFDFFQVNTPLNGDRAQFTGYFTPLLPAARGKTGGFSTPIYKRPDIGEDEAMPTRSAIERGALAGRKLEVGWLRSQADLRSIQMQGSCFLKFPDGRVQLIGYDGTNRSSKSAVSEDDKKGRDEHNYVFFRPMKNEVCGAMTEPLTAGLSVAIDPDIVPLGSCLLAELKGPDGRPDWHLLLAQDVGGGIQGTKRFDLYCGTGQPFTMGARVNDLGRVWLLLPKK